MQKKIILASSSPRRRGILAEMGYDFKAVSPDFDEDKVKIGDPDKLVAALAEGKALEVAEKESGALVIGADTVVVFEGRILGKPRTEDEAREMLCGYSGKECLVVTGYCLVDSDTGEKSVGVETTRLKMNIVTEEEVEVYIATGEPLTRAGGFSVHGKYTAGNSLVGSYEGSYTNILGFPREKIGPLIERMLR